MDTIPIRLQIQNGHWHVFDHMGDDCRCVVEDPSGNLWIATDAGVNRYDGRQVTTFSSRDGLCADDIRCLALDPQGRLWVGSWSHGVSCMDGDRVLRHVSSAQGLSSDNVQCLATDPGGQVWIGTTKGLHTVSDRTLRSYGIPDGLPDDWIHCILPEPEGAALIGTRKGLTRIGPEPGSVHPVTIPNLGPRSVTCLATGPDGILWIGTNSGLCRWDGHALQCYTASGDGLVHNYIRCLFVDRFGRVWTGSHRHGLSCLHEGQFLNFSTSNGLPHNNVVHIAATAEGSLLLSCEHGGIARFDLRGLSHISSDPVAEVMVRRRNGEIWWARERTLMAWDGHDARKVHAFDHPIFALTEDHLDHLWIGTMAGLWRYDRERLAAHRPPQPFLLDGNPVGWVWMIREDRQGVLWIGRTSEGVLRCENDVLSQASGPLRALQVSTACFDNADRVWLGCWSGSELTCVSGDLSHSYTVQDGLPENRVTDIIQTQDGNIWITTPRAVSCFDGRFFRNFTEEDGLPGRFAQRIMQDSRGQIWIAFLGGGIARFDGRFFQTLTSDDGLPSARVTGIVEQSDGSMVISTYRGICQYQPDYDAPPPPVFVDEVEADRVYPPSELIAFPETTPAVRFRFHGISLKTRHLRFAYMLEGFETDWRSTSEREVRYERLPRGDYTFKVMAISRDLVCSAQPASAHVRVLEDPREKEIRELQAEVKTLTGLLPICASCKKIRSQQGDWQPIEVYIRDHSEADFTHGLCPACAGKMWSEWQEELGRNPPRPG